MGRAGKKRSMSKELKLSRWEAQERILLFLKRRKGKTITEKTVNDLSKLLLKLNDNFKSYGAHTIYESILDDYKAKELALKAIRCQFMEFEKGGNCRLSDIDNFSLYDDEKYRVSIKGQLREITTLDYWVLSYVFLGKR